MTCTLAWLEHGNKVLDRVIVDRPEVFLQAMVKLALVHRVEVGQPQSVRQAPHDGGGARRTRGARRAARSSRVREVPAQNGAA